MNCNRFPKKVMYGNAYVPYQSFEKIFTPEEALKKGTIFPSLVSNYRPCESMDEIMYLKGGFYG